MLRTGFRISSAEMLVHIYTITRRARPIQGVLLPCYVKAVLRYENYDDEKPEKSKS